MDGLTGALNTTRNESENSEDSDDREDRKTLKAKQIDPHIEEENKLIRAESFLEFEQKMERESQSNLKGYVIIWYLFWLISISASLTAIHWSW